MHARFEIYQQFEAFQTPEELVTENTAGSGWIFKENFLFVLLNWADNRHASVYFQCTLVFTDVYLKSA